MSLFFTRDIGIAKDFQFLLLLLKLNFILTLPLKLRGVPAIVVVEGL